MKQSLNYTTPFDFIYPFGQLETIEVKGKLIDINGEAIYGTVQWIEDNTVYSETSLDGHFTISVPKVATLEFRSLGFEPLRIRAFEVGQSVILELDKDNILDEVVVTATPKKKSNIFWWLFGIASVIFISAKGTGLAGASTKKCNNRTKCNGLKKNGQLKKGYKFGKNGAVVKVADKTTRKKTKTKAKPKATVPKQKTPTNLTWHQFIKGKMGKYMKSEGNHAKAMKRLSKEWKEYKSKGLGQPVNVTM